MPGLLSRSKSMRLLKGHRKDVVHQEQAILSVAPPVDSQTDVGVFRSATPHSRTEAKLETLDMPARPSTSGGPGDRRTHFHMKTNPVPSIHSQSDLTFAAPVKSSTIPSPLDLTDSREGIIGIALGSPTVGSHWNSTPQATSTNLSGTYGNMTSINHSNEASAFYASEAPKSKLSRWKSLFKKASPAPPQEKPSFYQLAQTVTTTRAARADSHHDDDDSLDSRVASKRNEERGRMPSPPTFKPDIRASRKHGMEDAVSPQPIADPTPARARAFTAGSLPINPRMSVQRSATTPIPLSKDAPTVFPSVPQVVVSKSAQDSGNLASEKPLLDVNIPDIKMERYSVMFGNLLQPNSNRSSSLLARRQGNTEKLKPLNALSVKETQESPIDYKIQRRATSPTVPSPSPRLSLFPNTSNSRAASPRSSSVPRMKALHRSKTSPEKSPLHQMFKTAEDATKSPDLIVQKHSPPVTMKPQSSTYLKPQQMSNTPSSVHSFESESESITLVVGTTGKSQTVHLDEREPEWEIFTNPSATVKTSNPTVSSIGRKESQRQPKVTRFSALSSNPASAPLDAPSPLQRISSMRSPPLSAGQTNEKNGARKVEGEGEATARAMVGVARSVSVSRANSPRALVRTATDLSSPERFVERQVLTPTMVEVRNRRSQRVQLVDA